MSDPEELNSHYAALVHDLVENRVVPLLDAGVNLSERRPPDAEWTPGTDLPSSGELAEYLAERF